jgi:hypothetical protein
MRRSGGTKGIRRCGPLSAASQALRLTGAAILVSDDMHLFGGHKRGYPMRIASFLLGLAFLAVSSAPAAAVDLTKIDRTIAKEPAYKSKPKYCLLVFGPKAESRVWLVLDGEVLYVDRNGNGDLTETGKMLKQQRAYPQQEFPTVFLSLPGQERRQLRVSVHHYRLEGEAQEGPHPGIDITIDGKAWRTPSKQFSDQPKDAPVIHLNGPVSLLCPHPPTFVPGKTTNLRIAIGTPGLGAYGWCRAREIVGPYARLLGEVEYPNQEAGGKPLRATFTLRVEDY